MTSRGRVGAVYVWGRPHLTIEDAPDHRRLRFAAHLVLFRIAQRLAYTRRRLVLGWVVVGTLGLAVAAALVAGGSPGWAVVAATFGPTFMAAVVRNRGIWVRRGSPGAGVREPRRPVPPSMGAATKRSLV